VSLWFATGTFWLKSGNRKWYFTSVIFHIFKIFSKMAPTILIKLSICNTLVVIYNLYGFVYLGKFVKGSYTLGKKRVFPKNMVLIENISHFSRIFLNKIIFYTNFYSLGFFEKLIVFEKMNSL
jgi:hypothetical protein